MIQSTNIGIKYYLNLKISATLTGTQYTVTCFNNKIGILFSTYNYLNHTSFITNYAQIYSDTIITDTLGWTTLRGSFIADSVYNFITIGNVFDNNNTDTVIAIPSNAQHSYYYFDDICISADSLYCELWTSLPEEVLKEKVIIYPVPATDILVIENIPFDCQEIEIYNIKGGLVLSAKIKKEFKKELDISTLEPAIYAVVLKKSSSVITKSFIKINH